MADYEALFQKIETSSNQGYVDEILAFNGF